MLYHELIKFFIKILKIKLKLTNKVKCKLVLEYLDVNLLENLIKE